MNVLQCNVNVKQINGDVMLITYECRDLRGVMVAWYRDYGTAVRFMLEFDVILLFHAL